MLGLRLPVFPLAIIAAGSLLTGCTSSGHSSRTCSNTADCIQQGVPGTCLPSPASSDSFCAFPDPTCPGDLRWGLLAGDELTSTCLGAEQADAAPVDAPVGDAAPTDSGLADAAATVDAGLPDARICGAAVEVGHTNQPAYESAVADGIAYVNAGNALSLYVVGNPSLPGLVGSYMPDNGLGAIGVAGNYAYIGEFLTPTSLGMRVIDVAAPSAPQAHGAIATGEFYAIDFRQDVAYVAAQVGLVAIDVSDPDDPIETFRSDTSWFIDVEVAGDVAFTTDARSHFQSWDLTSTDPTELDSLALTGRLATSSDHVVVVNSDTLHVIDVSNPRGIYEVGSLTIAGANLRDITLIGTTAYITDADAGIRIIDISAPTMPTQTSLLPLAGEPQRLVSDDRYLYVAAGDAGLRIIDTCP